MVSVVGWAGDAQSPFLDLLRYLVSWTVAMSRAAWHIFEKLDGGKGADGEDVSQFFQVLPDPRQYPDYYSVISKPVSLAEIKAALEGNPVQAPGQQPAAQGTVITSLATSHTVGEGRYTMADISRDVRRMVANAKRYNEPGSQVHRHAHAMGRLLRRAIKEVEEKDLDYAEDDDSEEETALWSCAVSLRKEAEGLERENAAELQKALARRRATEFSKRGERESGASSRQGDAVRALLSDEDVLRRGCEGLGAHAARRIGMGSYLGPYGAHSDQWWKHGRRGHGTGDASAPVWDHWSKWTPPHLWPAGSPLNPLDTACTAGAEWRRAWLAKALPVAHAANAAAAQRRGNEARQPEVAGSVGAGAAQPARGVGYLRFTCGGEVTGPALRAILPAGVLAVPGDAEGAGLLSPGPLADTLPWKRDGMCGVGGLLLPTTASAALDVSAAVEHGAGWRFDHPGDFGESLPSTAAAGVFSSPALSALMVCCSPRPPPAARSSDLRITLPSASTPAKQARQEGSPAPELLTPMFRASGGCSGASSPGEGFKSVAAVPRSSAFIGRCDSGDGLGFHPLHTRAWRAQYMKGLIRCLPWKEVARDGHSAVSAALGATIADRLASTEQVVSMGAVSGMPITHMVSSAGTAIRHASSQSRHLGDQAVVGAQRHIQGSVRILHPEEQPKGAVRPASSVQGDVLVEWNPHLEVGVIYGAPVETPASPSPALQAAHARDAPLPPVTVPPLVVVFHQSESTTTRQRRLSTCSSATEGASSSVSGDVGKDAAASSRHRASSFGSGGLSVDTRPEAREASTPASQLALPPQRAGQKAGKGRASAETPGGSKARSKTTTPHKRMQLQDVWGVEGLHVYCNGSGRSSHHLRAGVLIGGRIACFCGCDKLYSGSGFAQHTDNTKHRPLQTVLLLGTKMRLQDALRQVRDSGSSPQDLQTPSIVMEGVRTINEAYTQPGMQVRAAANPVQVNSIPVPGQESALATTTPPMHLTQGPSQLPGMLSESPEMDDHDEDEDMMYLSGFPGHGEESGPFAAADSSAGARFRDSDGLVHNSQMEVAAQTAVPSIALPLQVMQGGTAAQHVPAPDLVAMDASGKQPLPEHLLHLATQHPLSAAQSVSLGVAAAILQREVYKGVRPFSALGSEDVEPEKLRQCGLASPSSSFSVHVLQTQLFSQPQRVAAAAAAGALAAPAALEQVGVPSSVAASQGRRQGVATPTSAAEFGRENKGAASRKGWKKARAASPSALAAGSRKVNKAGKAARRGSKRPRSQGDPLTVEDSMAAGAAGHPAAAVGQGVSVQAVDFTPEQVLDIHNLAHEGCTGEGVSLPLKVWVPDSCPAARMQAAIAEGSEGGGPGASRSAALVTVPLTLSAGLKIDCLFKGQWWAATIRRAELDATQFQRAKHRARRAPAGVEQPGTPSPPSRKWGVLVHYNGWNAKFDEWVVGDIEMINKFAPYGTFTDVLGLASTGAKAKRARRSSVASTASSRGAD